MFQEFPKIPRLKRDVVITEKIDGTNACVFITAEAVQGIQPLAILAADGLGEFATTYMYAQSRTRLITPDNDNYGFARWVQENSSELWKLGEGHHFGEWWGAGIQRRYGLAEKRFSLFNTGRWGEAYKARQAGHENGFPLCVHVVPVVCTSKGFDGVDYAMQTLRDHGSLAAPGFMEPEGVVVYHVQSRTLYKSLLENDDIPKGAAA